MELQMNILGRRLRILITRKFDFESPSIDYSRDLDVGYRWTLESRDFPAVESNEADVDERDFELTSPPSSSSGGQNEESGERPGSLNSAEIEEKAEAATRELKAMADQARQRLHLDLRDMGES